MRKYLWSLIATVFWKMNDVLTLSPLQAVTYTVKLVIWKKWLEIGTLLLHATNRNYYRAYQFVPFPMTLDDLEGHSPNAGLTKCSSTNICATFSTVLTARCVVPRDNWASSFASNMANLVSILCLQTSCHWAWLKVQIYQQHINVIYSNRCWIPPLKGFHL